MTTSKDTVHVTMDVPDELAGPMMRYIAGLRGVTNIGYHVNGKVRRKGEKPSRENEGSKRDVILALFTENDRVSRVQIQAALSGAGFSVKGISGIIAPMVQEKLIRRVSRGVYSASVVKTARVKKKKAA